MGLVRALVVDDEPPALAELTWLLEQDGRCTEVLAAGSGTEALQALEAGRVDVVFSDISMPGLDGMSLARVIARFADRPQVVFVTAHDQHAVDAFAVQATDYVMKPVSAARLAQAVDRVLEGLRPAPLSPRPASTSPGPADPAPPHTPDERIAVELGGVTRFVQRSSVRYVQAQGDYARLFTASGSHLLRIPLTTLEQRWAGAGFVRIHRSTLVSLAHVTEVRQGQGRLSLVLAPDGTELPVARRHAREVRDRVLRAAADPTP